MSDAGLTHDQTLGKVRSKQCVMPFHLRVSVLTISHLPTQFIHQIHIHNTMADPLRCVAAGLRPEVTREQLHRALLKMQQERDDLAMDLEEAYKEKGLVSRPRKRKKQDHGDTEEDPEEVGERKRVAEQVTRNLHHHYKFSRKEDLYGWTDINDGTMCSRVRKAFCKAGLRFNRHIWAEVCSIEREWLVKRRSYIVTIVRGGCLGED